MKIGMMNEQVALTCRRAVKRRRLVIGLSLFVTGATMSIASVCAGEAPPSSGDLPPTLPSAWSERRTLTDDWLGIGRELAERGVSVSLGLTQIYQIAGRGPVTHRHAGRYTGSYDFESEFDLERLAKIPGALVVVHVEGGWSEGLGESSIGSVMGVNGDAFGNDEVVLTELFWEQAILDGRVRLRVGKLDLTGGYACRHCDVAFDTNSYANDEAAQFLNDALINNPTIPFPDYGLGASVFVEPIDGWYVAAGVADAQAARNTTGFNSTFHGEDYFFSIYETGVTPLIPTPWGRLPGAYRVGFWYDPQDKDPHDGGDAKRDDVGFYLSFDQMLFKESPDDVDDGQGVGVFFRYGSADRDVNETHTFWSVGGQVQGLIPTRDDDVLGFGVAQSLLVGDAGFSKPSETVLEVYYNIQVAPWLQIAPSIQHVANTGGDETSRDATIFGVRMQVSF